MVSMAREKWFANDRVGMGSDFRSRSRIQLERFRVLWVWLDAKLNSANSQFFIMLEEVHI